MDPSGKRGKPFQPGNKLGKGRPAGSRNKATLALEEMLEGEAEAITRKAIQLAKKGVMPAIRLCMERLYPPLREGRLKLELPQVGTAEGVHNAFRAVVQGLAEGRLTTGQAEHMTNVLEFGRKSIETHEVARRLAELENQLKQIKELKVT